MGLVSLQMGLTFSACGPLGPMPSVNETRWPCARSSNRTPWTADMWKKMSLPGLVSMKPKPLSVNLLIVPSAMNPPSNVKYDLSTRLRALVLRSACRRFRGPQSGRASSMRNPPPFSSSDGTTPYLVPLARVPLLTREGEIEIAKRIEAAEHQVLAALGDCKTGRHLVSQLGAALRRGDLRTREVVRGFDAEDPDWEDTERRRVLRHVAKLVSPAASAQTVTAALVAMRLVRGAVDEV